jgi:hypothetical protein
MKEVSDGGGIYTLGFQPGTIIRHNHVHDIQKGPYAHHSPNLGLYFDAGSSGFLVKENLVYQASGGPTRLKEKPESFTFENNAFMKGPDNDKTALPEVRGKAGLEEKWKELQDK